MPSGPRVRDIGLLIREHRRQRGLTQHHAADLAQLSVAGLRDLEQGRVRRPRRETVRRLARALDLSTEDTERLLNAAQRGTGTHVDVLGPLRVTIDGTDTDLGSATQRTLLGLLAVTPNAPVPGDALVEAVWGTAATATPTSRLQSRISRLRHQLHLSGDARLTATGGGYQLTLPDERTDLLTFRRLLAQARRCRTAGTLPEACESFRDALALWRGRPLADLPDLATHPVVVGLRGDWHDAVVEFAETAELLGHHDEVLPLLRQVVADDPVHEPAHASLMIALAGCGRQAAALTVFGELRDRLADTLGVDPGPRVLLAHQRVLRQQVDHAGPSSRRRGDTGATAPAHRQLPPDIADFCGRGAELAALHEWLRTDGARVATVHGMAGVGKTRLAVRFAHQLVAAGRCPDAQLYVDLGGHADHAPADPADVLASFLRLLGVPGESIPTGVQARAAVYRDRMRDRNALVLLDNAASEEQVRPLLPTGPANLVLVTSRRTIALDGAETHIVDTFAVDEALALLDRVAGHGRTEAEPDAARAVVDLCGRLPLAVALAARRLRARPAWTVSDLATTLSEAGDRLAALSVGTRRVRAAFELSYRDLGSEQRRLFRMLGLFPSTEFGPAAAAAMTDTTVQSTQDILESLVDEHLLTATTGGRYRMHDLIRRYAADLAHDEDPPASRHTAGTRLVRYYVDSAERVGGSPDRAAATRWFGAERHCLVEAVGYADRHGLPEYAWRLAHALGEHLSLGGHFDDWVRTGETALRAVTAAGDRAGEAVTRTDLGAALVYRGDPATGVRHLDQALALHQLANDPVLETTTLSWLAIARHRLGDFAVALRHTRRAARLCASHAPDREGELLCHNSAGALLAELGYTREAIDRCERGLALFRRLGDPHRECRAVATLGDVHRRRGAHDTALRLLNRALAIATEHDQVTNQPYVRHRLANTYLATGRIDDALAQLDNAWRLARRLTGPDSRSELVIDLGIAHRMAGNADTAHDLLTLGLTMATETGERHQRAVAAQHLESDTADPTTTPPRVVGLAADG